MNENYFKLLSCRTACSTAAGDGCGHKEKVEIFKPPLLQAAAVLGELLPEATKRL